MKKIKRVGRLQPRGAVEFYMNNLELYEKLKKGETIEVSDDVFSTLKGVQETQETIEEKLKSYSRSKKKKKHSSRTLSQSRIEANMDEKSREEANRIKPIRSGDIVLKAEEEISIGDGPKED